MFLALAYFGCDQSQVQRYLTGKSIAQSRLSLLFNAMAKIPMQFFILFIGAMVFVLFIFDKAAAAVSAGGAEARSRADPRFPPCSSATTRRSTSARKPRRNIWQPSAPAEPLRSRRASSRFTRARSVELNNAHAAGEQLVGKDFHDTNFIFLSFVTNYLPVGVVGLIIAVIFTAAMSSTSGEINSLAAVTVIDLYQRHIRKDASDHHYLTRIALGDGVLGHVTRWASRSTAGISER